MSFRWMRSERRTEMGAEIVNLRQARKRRLRDEKAKEAEENRLAFGRTKSEKQLTRTLNRKQRRLLDQQRLDPDSQRDKTSRDDQSG